MTRAIDIDCPNTKTQESVRIAGVEIERSIGCGAVAGQYCSGLGIGVDLCQERINAASAVTRAARKRRPI